MIKIQSYTPLLCSSIVSWVSILILKPLIIAGHLRNTSYPHGFSTENPISKQKRDYIYDYVYFANKEEMTVKPDQVLSSFAGTGITTVQKLGRHE